MLNFGYLLIVNNDENFEYHRMANLLAASIKRTQPSGYDNVTLITDNLSANNGDNFFDNVITTDLDCKGWDQRSYMLDLSPYTHTVCLDVDMIFTRDISHWIDYFVNKTNGLVVTQNVLKFNGDKLTNLKCRPGYVENNLPILYSAFTYFNKQSGTAQDFFKIVKAITENKELFRNLYMSKKFPPDIGTDEAFSIAASILDIQFDKSSFPKFVHLKPELQDVDISSVDRDLGYYLDVNANITVGTFSQHEILHYPEKLFPSDLLMDIYKEKMIQGFKNV
jgi:hypothetical protein